MNDFLLKGNAVQRFRSTDLIRIWKFLLTLMRLTFKAHISKTADLTAKLIKAKMLLGRFSTKKVTTINRFAPHETKAYISIMVALT